jgi:hypothetical protein
VTELAARARETGGRLADVIYRGGLLSTAAMAVRNAVLLAILAVGVLADSALLLVLMLLASLALAWQARAAPRPPRRCHRSASRRRSRCRRRSSSG